VGKRLAIFAAWAIASAACGLSVQGTGAGAVDGADAAASLDATTNASGDGAVGATGDGGSKLGDGGATDASASESGTTLDGGSGGTDGSTGAFTYLGRVGTKNTTSTGTVTIDVASVVPQAGDLLIVSVLLGNAGSTTPSATDTAGNTYNVAVSANDGGDNDKMFVFTSVAGAALAMGGTITLTLPQADKASATADAFRGVTTIDNHVGTGSSSSCSTFDSGQITLATTSLVYGVVGFESGSATWPAGWTSLPALTSSGDGTSAAHRTAGASTLSATGTCTGTGWMSAVLSFH
jgi:hypothetical protein